MKISVNDVGQIAREWFSNYVVSGIDNQGIKYGIIFYLNYKAKDIDSKIEAKVKPFADNGMLDIDAMLPVAKSVLQNNFNGKVHIPELNYDADVSDIDNFVETAKKYAR